MQRLWAHEWVVYAKKPFLGPEQILRYLGRYTHRVGISNERLEEISAETVTFHTKGGKRATLTHEVFLERFVQHVLPPGFVKIRHYGLHASGNAKTKLEVARQLLEAQGAEPRPKRPRGEDESWLDFFARLTGRDPTLCPVCKVGRLVRTALPLPLTYDLRGALREGKGPDP